MVEGFVFIAEGMNKCEINLGSAHLRNFFRLMEVDFLNQAVKLVDVILLADGRIFMEPEENDFSDVSSHILDVTVFILQKGLDPYSMIILNTLILSTLLRHFNNASIARVFLSSQLSWRLRWDSSASSKLSSDFGSFSRMSLSILYTLNVVRADAVQKWYSDEVNGARVITLILEISDTAIDCFELRIWDGFWVMNWVKSIDISMENSMNERGYLYLTEIRVTLHRKAWLCTDSVINRILLETGFEAQRDSSWFGENVIIIPSDRNGYFGRNMAKVFALCNISKFRHHHLRSCDIVLPW